jgi:hypothetical protein
MTINDIAMVCHEANRALCLANGDASQKPWPEAEPWQRESAIAGVTWRIEHMTAPASAQHHQWCDDKARGGWKYGPVKDAEKKEHPCLVPFDKLPKDQQAKDVLFMSIVSALRRLLS